MIAGADGWRGRWVVACDDGAGIEIIIVDDILAWATHGGTVRLLIIDVPIGLPETGARACDIEARRRIGPRRSSVFPAPLRPLLEAQTADEASGLRRRIEGKGVSRQAWGIFGNVRTIDAGMTRARQRRTREGHPELSFAALAGRALAHSKHTADGLLARRALLEASLPGALAAIDRFGRPGALRDALDACALLWTARRVVSGEASVLPEDGVERDRRGLRMEIVY